MNAKRKHSWDMYRAVVGHAEKSDGGVPVTIYTSSGRRMVEKVGFVSPDGTRCYVELFKERVQATREKGAWVYRVPALEAA